MEEEIEQPIIEYTKRIPMPEHFCGLKFQALYDPIEPRAEEWDLLVPEDFTEEMVLAACKTPEELSEEKISVLWEYFSKHINKEMDEYSRHTISVMLQDPDTTENQKTRIKTYTLWFKQCWDLYYSYREQIVEEQYVNIEAIYISDCPYTIKQITEEN